MSAILTPRQRRMLRAAQRAKAERDPSESGGELNIVPFLDIVVNLMLFLLATSAVTMAVAQIEVDVPGTCGGRDCPEIEPGLDLTATITDRGVVLSGHDGFVAPGCEQTSSAAVTTIAGHDYEALRACAERLHAAYPIERSVIITADPAVEYEHVIATMDAMRGSDDAPLFPGVRLAAGLR